MKYLLAVLSALAEKNRTNRFMEKHRLVYCFEHEEEWDAYAKDNYFTRKFNQYYDQ